MKNVDLKKVQHLVCLQMTEQKKNILVLPTVFAITLTLTLWMMNMGAIQEGVASSFQMVIGLALLFSVITYLNNFINRKSTISNLLVPVSSLDKYISIWSAGILTALFTMIFACFIMSILWFIICTIGYEMTIGEICHAAFPPESFLSPLVSLMITAGFVTCIIGSHQKNRMKYAIPIFFISLIIAWIVLLGILPNAFGEEGKKICLIFMLVLGFFFSIGFMIWGYFLFKKIQFIHK